ncbi:uncharacterized protein PHALS_00456 [Plasmopara halstedii]|uniref:Uncharacterized protein n=1 Tax=Plasmopara halstedii TaxID=4781 RepID=A0A0P1A6C4_PLAHL|nr:uncharacterized protein PHALS_00456 [Plasmopara halstedii]CEG36138.1 hypothetical protein PHALS_00456 [Plasmopara halstedii]|eukprot:XP_024572507.1 hypothetical protein PHALS_00456 [Plasmopara halstedii]
MNWQERYDGEESIGGREDAAKRVCIKDVFTTESDLAESNILEVDGTSQCFDQE